MTTNPPDLTSPEAVERLAAHIHKTCGCALGANAEQPVAATLRVLSAALETERANLRHYKHEVLETHMANETDAEARAEAAENTLALCEDQRQEWEHHCKAAEAQLAALKAEVARLREALKPFASIVDKDGENIVLKWGKSTYSFVLFPKHFYEAHAALRAPEQGEG